MGGIKLEFFLEILTKPDNIPIAFMVLLILFFLWLGLKQAFKHDKLIKEGKKDQIYDEMIK
tara:strand:- start:27367 stop:27549 length:183 start_codon:yes stop_codon:yes gene_type:complete